jgi:glycosyltransferase involved in cell wall biosynthesis
MRKIVHADVMDQILPGNRQIHEHVQDKILVSVVLPCYNEEAILPGNLSRVIEYLNSKKESFRWQIVIVNDGSKDGTGEIADRFAKQNGNIRVIHHPVNLNLGHALQSGFRNSDGDIIVVLDVDLSYSEEYIGQMVAKMEETMADVVLASPYMKGGKVTGLPFMRELMSRVVNKFMSVAAQDKYHTFTSMARAYRGDFIRTLNLKTKDYEISPEIVYKGMILRSRMVEIPAHLDWTEQNKFAGKRTSSLRVFRGVLSGLMSGFIFRPYMFFIGVGTILFLLSMYQLVWLLYDTVAGMHHLSAAIPHPFSYSLSMQFRENPHTFLVGGITFLAAIQFLGLGFLSLQNKRYFEELFHLGTSLKKELHKNERI